MDIKDLFFRLLRTSLWGGSSDCEIADVSRGEMNGVLNLAKSQTVLGLIANEVMRSERLSVVLDDSDKKRLRHSAIANLSAFQMLNGTLLSIVIELRKHGIDPILLKGQGISQYYLLPELRQCGDIDIYVGQENFEKACSVLGEMSSSEDHESDISSQKHFHTRVGKAFVEIHRYTDVYFPKRLDRIYQKISDEGMSSDLVPMDFSGVQVSTPSVDFNVFFIFNHFWHHFIGGGVGLRQICDWTRLLHVNRGKINLDKLSSVLREMNLMKEWKVFGCIAVDTLGLSPDEMPFYDDKYRKKAAKVLELILLEGNFGWENLKGYNRPKGYVAGKWYSFWKRFGRNLRVLRLFPYEAIRYMCKVFFVGIAVMFNDKFSKYLDD